MGDTVTIEKSHLATLMRRANVRPTYLQLSNLLGIPCFVLVSCSLEALIRKKEGEGGGKLK